MKPNNRFFAALFSALVPMTSPLMAQERVALLIGNNDYPEDGNFHALKNCVNDVTLLEKTLKSVGFTVTKLTNATQAKMDEALLAFENSVPAGGTALVYFAGHGIEYQGQNYLMGSNAKLQARSRLGEEALKADTFAAAMVQAGAKTSFLLLDCCRELPASAEWAGRGQKKFGLADISIEGDIVIGMAASPGKQALEPSEAGGNSPYALALAKWIPKGLDHLDLFQSVRNEVNDMTDGQQRTWENGSFLKPFYFAEATESDGKDDESMAALKAEIERLRKEAAQAGAMKRTGPNSLPETNPGGAGFSADVKTRGFTNSLGMKMVPVPGTEVLFCEHETRVEDYAAYAAANPGVDMEWKDFEYEGHKQASDYPVVKVSWNDAKAFCAWLSKIEGNEYRLPTDHEWSVAVGIGDRENATESPKDKNGKIEGVYPWGTVFPPLGNAGNYSGIETMRALNIEAKRAFRFSGSIEEYSDGYALTAPVKSHQANEHGLYDLGGNAWEFCEDWYSSDENYRVLRGGSWISSAEYDLRSSYRFLGTPSYRDGNRGFRVVVVALGDAVAKSGIVSTMIQKNPISLPATKPGKTGVPADAMTRGFTNTLGMKFVPVPGTEVLFCEHETRVQDYAEYASANSGVDMKWKDNEYNGHWQASDHPVVNITWEDAKAFCEWLSEKEGNEYRLPADHEWSVAVGIGDRENVSDSPKEKSGKIEGVYPWGTVFPPPPGAGNYGGYQDDHPFTAPVKSYKANEHGLYDLGGNVWEWCEDWYSNDQKSRVVRGGSWYYNTGANLRSSYRSNRRPTDRYNGIYYGFRLVVVGVGG